MEPSIMGEQKKGKKVIQLTEDQGHFYLEGKLYKLARLVWTDRTKGPKGVFIEVNPKEYDKRIDSLAQRIAKYPGVNLIDLVKDALYDLELDHLDKLEKKLEEEEALAKEKGREPKVESRRGERGTCVELRIRGRYIMPLRQ